MEEPRSSMTPEKLEIFVNEYLREDLKELEKQIIIYNDEIMEFIQLKNTITTIRERKTNEDLLDSATEPAASDFKTQLDIGCNIFMEAEVKNPNLIYINVGKNIFVEFSLEEAIKFINFKLNILNKEVDVIRDESIKKRSEIKLALMCLGEHNELYRSFNKMEIN